jgi:hypothetical protein
LDRARRPRIVARCMLNREPLIGREGFDGPGAVEPAYAGILLSAKGAVGKIDHAPIVDMRHADLKASSETPAAFEIVRKDCAGKSILGIVGNRQGFILTKRTDDASDRSKKLLPRQIHGVGHVPTIEQWLKIALSCVSPCALSWPRQVCPRNCEPVSRESAKIYKI